METLSESKGKLRRRPRGRRAKNEKMDLGDYLRFIYSHSHRHLTNSHLNQIIGMHGYKKITAPKETLTDAVNSLSLVEPRRSTLKDYAISPFVMTTLEEVTADLEGLNWKECSVTSIVTWKHASCTFPLRSPADNAFVMYSNNHQQLAPLTSESEIIHPAKNLMPKKKRKISPGRGGDANAALDCVSYGSC